MADQEKHAVVRALKREYDENASKLRQASLVAAGAAGRAQANAGAPPPPPLPLLPPPPPLAACCRASLLPDPASSPHPSPLPQLESQKRMVESTLRRAAFTAAQLDEMPEDVATYRSVGKA